MNFSNHKEFELYYYTIQRVLKIVHEDIWPFNDMDVLHPTIRDYINAKHKVSSDIANLLTYKSDIKDKTK